MITPDTLSIWIKEQAWPIAIVLICAGLAFALLKYSAKRRVEKLLKEREGVTEQTFTEHLERYGFDAVITSATYRYLQEVQLVQFPIVPGDALDEDLGMDSEDVDQTVRELSVALHREQTPGLRYAPLVTVEDLVRLLQASPRLKQSQQHKVAA